VSGTINASLSINGGNAFIPSISPSFGSPRRTSPSSSISIEKPGLISPRNMITFKSTNVLDDTLIADPSVLKGKIYGMCKDQQGAFSIFLSFT
jgi:hypothetical protein